MASSPRDVEREEERRVNMRTLTIASAASAAAAAVTSQLWIAGTWIAAALTPVLVALISEALHRPTERVARVWTSERPPLAARRGKPVPDAIGKPAAGEAGPVRVYRQSRPRPKRKHVAIGAVAATGAIAFVIGIATLTTVDLVSGGSVGKGSGRTSLWSDSKDKDRNGETQESSPESRDQQQQQQQDQPESRPDSSEPAPEQSQEPPPSDTAPAPPPSEPAPGEPLPDAVP